MEFSTPEVVEQSLDYLKKMPIPECPGCKRGIRMCYNTPCMGTVDDIERLINAGYAKNLMLDWWVGVETQIKHTKSGKNLKPDNEFTEDVPYLVPAIVGRQGKQAPWNKKGRCNLLVDDQCSVHVIKPVQGKASCCKVEPETIIVEGEEQYIDERIKILHTWNTQRGKDLIIRWKQEVDFKLDDDETEGFSLPTNPLDMLMSMFDMLVGPQVPEHLKD